MRVREKRPVFGVLCLTAVAVLVAALGVRSLTAAPAQDATKSVWDGVYTEEQARRGLGIYQQYCTACHGPTLQGGEAAGALAGPVFTSNWNGVNMGDMLERVRVSMPLDRPGTLSRQQNADVLAYVLSVNRFPPGKTELARQTEYLRQIMFEATKKVSKAGS